MSHIEDEDKMFSLLTKLRNQPSRCFSHYSSSFACSCLFLNIQNSKLFQTLCVCVCVFCEKEFFEFSIEIILLIFLVLFILQSLISLRAFSWRILPLRALCSQPSGLTEEPAPKRFLPSSRSKLSACEYCIVARLKEIFTIKNLCFVITKCFFLLLDF